MAEQQKGLLAEKDGKEVTREELCELYDLQREVKEQQRRLREYYDTLKSPFLSGAPKGSGVSDPVGRAAELLEQQRGLVQENLERCLEQQNRLLQFIQSVPDSHMRRILCYRHLDGLNWVQVAHRMSVTPESVKMAYRRFFDKRGSA